MLALPVIYRRLNTVRFLLICIYRLTSVKHRSFPSKGFTVYNLAYS